MFSGKFEARLMQLMIQANIHSDFHYQRNRKVELKFQTEKGHLKTNIRTKIVLLCP